MTQPTATRRRAFTLLELVLVMAVIVALGVVVLPSLSASLAGGRLDGQARAVVGLVRKARALALTEGRAHVVVLDPAARTLRLARRRDPLAAPSDPEDPELEALPEGAPGAAPLPFEEDVQLVEVEVAGEALDAGAEVRLELRPSGEGDAAALVLEGARGERLIVLLDPAQGEARILREESVGR